MRRAAVPASLKNVCEGDKIGLHIVVGVVDAVPDSCLGREVNDAIEAVLRETGVDLSRVCQVRPYEPVSDIPLFGGLLQNPEARLLEGWVVIGIDHIEAYDRIATLQQSLSDVKADKACGTCNQDFHDRAAFDIAPGALLEERRGSRSRPIYARLLRLASIT